MQLRAGRSRAWCWSFVRDREALPDDRHLLSDEECLAWDSALAPREDQVKAATARLGEIAADIEADLGVLFGSVDPMPLRVLRDGDP